MIKNVNWKGFIAPLIVGILLWLVTPLRPVSISLMAWHLFAIFVATIIACITKPVPMMATTIIAVTIAVLVGVFKTQEVTTALGNNIAWMIVMCLFMSNGFVNTGLGKRIAYYFIKFFGKSTLGLAYAFSAVDLVLSIGIPSNNARINGIIYPIMDSLSKAFGSSPKENTQKKIGSYLVFNEYEIDIVTSGMFLTGLGGNMVSLSLAKTQGVNITWLSWFLAALVPGILSFILVPLLLYKIYPPQIKNTPDSKEWADKRIAKMGKMSTSEKIMTTVFILATLLWIIGPSFGIDATLVSFIAVSILLITGVITVKDMLTTKFAWNILTWLSIIILMAGKLSQLGFFKWFSTTLGGAFHGVNWILVLVLLFIIYFYLHYLFPSITSHITSLYPGFLSIAVGAGAPAMLAAQLLGFGGVVDLSTSPYSQGTAAFLSGTGYVDNGDWWKLNAIIGVLYIILWLGVGLLWTKIIGYW